jgi:DNA-binding HxlR family transcriptional regulator
VVASYKQFCPVAMAAEVLETRWTLLIVREICLGSKHFNELRRGVPKMSPTLLSKRLRELEDHGILTITTPNKFFDLLDRYARQWRDEVLE